MSSARSAKKAIFRLLQGAVLYKTATIAPLLSAISVQRVFSYKIINVISELRFQIVLTIQRAPASSAKQGITSITTTARIV